VWTDDFSNPYSIINWEGKPQVVPDRRPAPKKRPADSPGLVPRRS
jgi:hypothetical protein